MRGGGLPIDIVYLWVDGNDPEIIKKRNYWKEKYGKQINTQAIDPCRFVDNNELKYSLRSLEKYAPWINNIFIVTDNQIPKWLNTNHEKINIIDHSEIMPKDALPTFNSCAIETCICNIKGLSEYFLYANDDTFFYKYTSPTFFFTNQGFPIFRVRQKISKKHLQECIYFRSLKYSYKLIESHFNYKLYFEPHHNIDPYRKSDFFACNDIFKTEINKTIQNKFRTETDVQRVIYLSYACAIGEGKLKLVSKIDNDLPLYKKIVNLLTFKFRKDSIYFGVGDKRIDKKLEKYKPNLICINDQDSIINPESRIHLKATLEKYFPEKSSYEL